VPAHAHHVGAGALGLAVLHLGLRQRGELSVRDDRVHHQPWLVEVEVLQLDADAFADQARAAVASDQPRRDEARGLRVAGQQHVGPGVVGVLAHLTHLRPGGHLHVRQLGKARAQDALERRLLEHVIRRPAQAVRRRRGVEPLDELALHAAILAGPVR
jgi:hypothetical protein